MKGGGGDEGERGAKGDGREGSWREAAAPQGGDGAASSSWRAAESQRRLSPLRGAAGKACHHQLQRLPAAGAGMAGQVEYRRDRCESASEHAALLSARAARTARAPLLQQRQRALRACTQRAAARPPLAGPRQQTRPRMTRSRPFPTCRGHCRGPLRAEALHARRGEDNRVVRVLLQHLPIIG